MLLLELFGGFIYLLMAGDLLVRGAVALAKQFHIPPMLVGLTVVAFGTSAPELCVSVGAAFQGAPGIAMGNVVGSNIANALLVLGAPAVILPIACSQSSVRRDGLIMLAVSALFVALCLTGEVTRTGGALLLLGLLAYMAYSLWEAARSPTEAQAEIEWVLGLPRRARTAFFFIAIGLIWLPVGADLLIDAAVEIAAGLGVSDAVVGLTVVALGTSLPELATVVVAAAKGHTDLAVGNVLGSNILNILAIMGVAGVVSPRAIAVPPGFVAFDLPVLAAAALLLAWFTWRRAAIRRPVGALMTMGYVAYVALLYSGRSG